MATVLLTALAATITLVIVRQTVLVTRTESVRTDYGRAYNAALDVQADFERRLRDDPRFYLKQVFPWERPRGCDTPPAAPTPVFYSAAKQQLSAEFPWVVPPADPMDPDAGLSSSDASSVGVGTWPASCGSTWRYLPTGAPLLGFNPQTVRAEIVPPSPDDPAVTLRVLATVGSQETGLRAVYRPETVAGVTVYTGTDLRLDNLYAKDAADTSSAPVQVNGSVYSAGRVWLPTGDVDLAGAQIFAENGFVGQAKNSAARLYTGRTSEISPDQQNAFDIRSSVAHPLTMESLRSSAGRIAQVGCPDGTDDPVNYPPGHPRETNSSQLCLRSGGKVITSDSDTATALPAGVKAWLLMPTGTNVAVYYATSTPQAGGDCRIACKVTDLARADLAAGTHPGGPLAGSSLWTSAGTYRLPASGVIATDATTYVSHCAGFDATGAAAQHPLVDVDGNALKKSDGTPATGPQCAPEPGGPDAGGVEVAESFTVLAGTPRNPADLVLAGPVRTDEGARLGLAATGAVRIPYWSRPAGGDLPVAAAVVAYGFGVDGPAVSTLPAQMPARSGDADPNYGQSLVLHGSLAAPSLDSGIAGFRRVQVNSDQVLRTAPPPYFATFSDRYVRASSVRLSPQTVCSVQGGGRVDRCFGRW